ncbi:MAG: phosphate/phosphite/phosphonate ABC transporter substrate-binding protein [Rhodoferax sp.]|nr:phosphate/phosphite/phosphonate ABC transporter substrate-binding protein [Rhodoferax sp.]
MSTSGQDDWGNDSTRRWWGTAAAGFWLALSFAACSPPATEVALQYSKAPASGAPELYRLAVHPLHNPQKLASAYQPLVDHLNSELGGVQIELEASRDYQVFEQKFRNREPAFLLPNPWQTLEAQKLGYEVIAMAGDAADFKGIFIVRKDSGITVPADLKGKTVSYPSRTALAAAIMPQQFLHEHGVDVNRDIVNAYVGSQESSIMNVYLGQAAAGATWPPPWRLFQKDYPAEASHLRVIWETPPLINNSVMVRNDVPTSLRDKVTGMLLGLHTRPHGAKVLSAMETARFHPANDDSYAEVKSYVARFERNIRPVEAR